MSTLQALIAHGRVANQNPLSYMEGWVVGASDLANHVRVKWDNGETYDEYVEDVDPIPHILQPSS